MMKPAVFLDRDGTLIEERHYLSRPEQVVLYAETIGALKKFDDFGFLLFLVTNQSGVGRGYFTMEDMAKVHGRLKELLQPAGLSFAEIYIAPESPDQPSAGRKPSPHFLFQARDRFDLDLNRSYMIGDKLIDLQCGWNAGVRQSLLVRTGYGKEHEMKFRDFLDRAQVVDDMMQAAEWILNDVKDQS